MVGFEQSSYTVDETSPVLDVCIWLSGASFSTTTMLRPVTLRVASQGDTATGYIPPPPPPTHTHAQTHAHTHMHTHTYTHAHTQLTQTHNRVHKH